MQPLIPPESERDLLVCAFRYALSRQSAATGIAQDALRHAWPQLAADDRAMFKREIREAGHRAMLGMWDVDRPGWLKILELSD